MSIFAAVRSGGFMRWLVLAALVVAPHFPARAQSKSPATVTAMVGIYPGAPQVSIYWVGKPLGFFAEENIDAQVLVAPNSNMAQGTQLVIGGQADAVLTSIESVLLPFSQGKDAGLVFVYSFYTRPQYRMIVRSDSPIKSLADLKGKTIGISHSGNPAEPMLRAYLTDGGLKVSDVNIQVIGDGLQGAEALKNGLVAAAQQVSMTGSTWKQAGYDFDYLPEPEQFEHLIGAAVAVKRAALKDPERRAAIVRLLRSWAKSAVFVKNNPRAAVELDFRQFPQAKYRGVSDDESLRRGIAAQDAIIDTYTTKVEGKWGAFRPDTFRLYTEFLGIADKAVDTSSLWSNELIDEINDFDEAPIVAKAKSYKAEDYK